MSLFEWIVTIIVAQLLWLVPLDIHLSFKRLATVRKIQDMIDDELLELLRQIEWNTKK